MLQPGGSQPVTFSFFGHANISSQVLALCEVEGGPVYEITLKGEASLVTYSLDTTDFCLGHQVQYAQVTFKSYIGFHYLMKTCWVI